MSGRIFFSCAIALVAGCSLNEPTQRLESTLADDNVEVAACELEVDCCGNLNCAPAPCPIFCI